MTKRDCSFEAPSDWKGETEAAEHRAEKQTSNTITIIATIINNKTIIATNDNKHRKNCECCHHRSLFKGHNVNVNIVVLNCQKCNQCLKCQVSGHQSGGLLFEGVL